MKEQITELISQINNDNRSSIIALKLSIFIAKNIKAGNITLYEMYLLEMEYIRFTLLKFNEPATFSTGLDRFCITLVNQWFLSLVFNENKIANVIQTWSQQAYQMLKKEDQHKNWDKHYILKNYNDFFNSKPEEKLLKNLLKYRDNYDILSDNDGPYHYAFINGEFNYEDFLLKGAKWKDFSVKEEIQELLVELNIIA